MCNYVFIINMLEKIRRFFMSLTGSSTRRIYFDYAAATPIRREVMDAMRPYMRDIFANPSATHYEGRKAWKAIEFARSDISKMLHVRCDEILFTSGGTESNNLALFGVVDALISEGVVCDDMEIITTRSEHPSVLEAVSELEKRGIHVVYVPVDEYGLIEIETLKKMIRIKTVLITFAYANSETGVVQDVKKITKLVRESKGGIKRKRPYVHLDASQAPLYLPCSVDSLGVDLMTLDSGKYYGPKGAGVLIKKSYVKLRAQLRGGGQEQGLRAGTENTSLIVGCARALILAQENYRERVERIQELRDHFFRELRRAIPDMIINGSVTSRIANNVNISIPGVDGEYAVVTLDVKGVAASTRSACSGKTSGGSLVIMAMGGDEHRALGTIRFTLGEDTTKEDIKFAIDVLVSHVKMVRG